MRNYVLLIEDDPVLARILRRVIEERCPDIDSVIVIKDIDSFDRTFQRHGDKVKTIIMTCCQKPQCCEANDTAEQLRNARFSGKIIDLSSVKPNRLSLTESAVSEFRKVMPVIKILRDL